MGLMQALQNYDQGRMMAARGQVAGQEKAAATLIADERKRRLQNLRGRDTESLSPEMLALYERMQKAGVQSPGVPREYEILKQAVENTPTNAEKLLAAKVMGDDRDVILRQLAAEQAYSPRADVMSALAGLNRTMGREDWVGALARRAPEAAAAGGATAGALGLIELINYLQGSGQGEEPMA